MDQSISLPKRLGKFAMEYLVLVALVLLVLITVIVEPKFMTGDNLLNILLQFGPLSLVALGMTFVILGGFIDLSVPGIINLVAVVTVSLVDVVGQFPAIILGMLLGAALGGINSSLILLGGAMSQAEALFITFGMSSVYSALALMYTGGATLRLSYLASSTSMFDAIGSGSLMGLPVSFLIFLLAFIVLLLFQNKTYSGRSISYTGGNKVAANLAGMPVKRSVAKIYSLSGLMAALGAIVLVSRITTAAPIIGKDFDTNAILSVVVGGSSMKGGRGSVARTVMGVLLVTLMSNCMNLLGVGPNMQVVLRGAILVAAIWLDNRKTL